MTTLMDVEARPLGIRPEVFLTDEQLGMLQRLNEAEFPYVSEKLLAAGSVRGSDIDEAVFEFKRYMALTALTENTLGMISPIVDEVWHQFILFTRAYAKFCRQVFGRYVHHLPATSHTPVEPGSGHNFVSAYEENFGPLTRLWANHQATDCSASTGDNSCDSGQCSGPQN